MFSRGVQYTVLYSLDVSNDTMFDGHSNFVVAVQKHTNREIRYFPGLPAFAMRAMSHAGVDYK